MEELVPVTPLTVALTVAVPGSTAVTRPLLLTSKTLVLLVVQLVTKLVTVTPEAPVKLPAAEACCVVPPDMLPLGTETETEAGVRLVATVDGLPAALTSR